MRDEQAETDHLEAVCGGVEQAQRLFRIYKDSYPNQHPNPRYSKTKEQVFWNRAIAVGFTDEQCDALLDCQ